MIRCRCPVDRRCFWHGWLDGEKAEGFAHQRVSFVVAVRHRCVTSLTRSMDGASRALLLSMCRTERESLQIERLVDYFQLLFPR